MRRSGRCIKFNKLGVLLEKGLLFVFVSLQIIERFPVCRLDSNLGPITRRDSGTITGVNMEKNTSVSS